MTRLKWNENGEHFYETGIDRGVFYSEKGSGVAWDGLISITDASDGAEAIFNYIDGVGYKNERVSEGFAASLEAFTYPDEFIEYDGISERINNQPRKSFGLCYRTMIGNDIDGIDHGYRLHLIYNALAIPSDRVYSTINTSLEPTSFVWDISTTPIVVEGIKETSHLFIDSTQAYPWTMAALENVLYGNEDQASSLPSPEEVLALFEINSILLITDNGDGTFTASGPDDVVSLIDETTFQISWPTVVYIDEVTYKVHSL